MSDTGVCLLIDNSNTRTKFALSGSGPHGEVRVLPTARITPETVETVLQGWVFSRVCLCSVVPHAARLITRSLATFPITMLTPEIASSIDFSTYPGVATLGADRVANVLAAAECAPLPLVAVDLGTATTFDVLLDGERPRFVGGMIAPGYAALAASLPAGTALLPTVAPEAQGPVIGRNTREAMASALRVGYPGMVESLLDAIEAELGENIHVVLTGGDAATVAAHLRRTCHLEPRLTLQGIALAVETHL